MSAASRRQLAQQTLSQAYYYEFQGTGHGVSVSGECGPAVMESFWAEPTEEPDTTCLDEMGSPHFTVEGDSVEAVTLVPFANSQFGISGVVPEGWTEVTAGTYSRGNSGLDQTVIVQQAAPGIDPEQLLGVLASQLGWASTPESSDSYEDGNGRSWTLYAADVQGFPVNVAFAEEDGVTLLVLLITAADEEAALFDAVFMPALEALTVQE